MELATADDLTRWLTVAYCVFGVATITTFIRYVAFPLPLSDRSHLLSSKIFVLPQF
jgi:hypothetical protein